MSSKTVRDAFEAAFATLLPTLPLESTDNEEPDRSTLGAAWATADYLSYGENRVSLGASACRRETGLITVVVFVKAGTGSSTALTWAESIRNAFRDWKDATGKITATAVSPGESGSASDGRWFAVSVDINYTFDNYL